MPNNNAANLVFGHTSVHRKAKPHEHPRQPRRLEHQHPQETQKCVWIAPAPDVNEDGGQCGAEKGDAEERRDAEEQHGGKGEEV